MKFRNFVKENISDIFFEATKPKSKAPVSVLKPKEKTTAKEKPSDKKKKEITPEQIARWNKWSAGEQNYILDRYPEGVYASHLGAPLKQKDSKAKKIETKHEEELGKEKEKPKEAVSPAGITDHQKDAIKKIKNKEFSSIVKSKETDQEKTKKFDSLLKGMEQEELSKFLHNFHDQFGEGGETGAPAWSEDVYKKYAAKVEKVEKEKATKKQEKVLKTLKEKGGMDRSIIDIIDGDAKKGAYEGRTKAPGNKSSFINETSIGTCLSYLHQNPNMNVNQLYQKLWKEIKDTDVVYKNGEELSQKAAYAAAISAKAEHRRIKRVMKEDGFNPKTTTVSHVWGSKESLQNTVDFLDKMGVVEVNGVSFNKYKSVILGGGAGDNPTDTMSVLIDHSQKPPKAVILHTSNKTSTSDIQGNSSPVSNVKKMLSYAEEDLNDGKISAKEYNAYKKACDRLVKRLEEKQSEVEGVISKEYDKLYQRALKPNERKKLIDEIKKSSTGDEPAKYWNSIVKRYYEGDTPIKGRTFNSKTGTYKPPLTDEEEKKILLSYVNELKASVVDDTIDVSKEMSKVASRIAPFDEKAMAGKYQEQHMLQNEARKEMNKALKGKGDEYFSKLFIDRFHGHIVSGHNVGGIPAKYFELNMGKNNSRIRYDEQGNPWERKMVTVKEKGKEKQVERFTRIVNGQEVTRTITGLTDGDTATVGNTETFSKCLGLKTKKDKQDFWKHIRVSEVKCSSTDVEDDDDFDTEGKKVRGLSSSGYANIYGIDREGKEFLIGVQTLRPKGGKGSTVQDTIQFHKDFQTCLQLESHQDTKLNEMFKYIIQMSIDFINRRKD